MPTYVYTCSKCGHLFELRQSFHETPIGFCPVCKGKAKRKFYAVPVIYKGSGFYSTDYRKGQKEE